MMISSFRSPVICFSGMSPCGVFGKKVAGSQAYFCSDAGTAVSIVAER